jgi:hypothetical protein
MVMMTMTMKEAVLLCVCRSREALWRGGKQMCKGGREIRWMDFKVKS